MCVATEKVTTGCSCDPRSCGSAPTRPNMVTLLTAAFRIYKFLYWLCHLFVCDFYVLFSILAGAGADELVAPRAVRLWKPFTTGFSYNYIRYGHISFCLTLPNFSPFELTMRLLCCIILACFMRQTISIGTISCYCFVQPTSRDCRSSIATSIVKHIKLFIFDNIRYTKIEFLNLVLQ